MNELECQLKKLILSNYGSLKKFTEKINMPWTTLDSILKRGVSNSKSNNILKICEELELDSNSLMNGEIISKVESARRDFAEASQNTYYIDKETEKVAQEIKDNKELSLLFDAARDASAEDLQTVHTMLLALKKKENGEND